MSVAACVYCISLRVDFDLLSFPFAAIDMRIRSGNRRRRPFLCNGVVCRLAIVEMIGEREELVERTGKKGKIQSKTRRK